MRLRGAPREPVLPHWRHAVPDRGRVRALGDLIAPFDPLKNNFRYRLGQPNGTHLFGTDNFGRDILSRVLHGSRVSLLIGLLVVLLTGVFGTLIGAISGYVRSHDNLIMRIMDGFMAFPPILLAIAVVRCSGLRS